MSATPSEEDKESNAIIGSLTLEESSFLQRTIDNDEATDDDKAKAQAIVDRIAKELVNNGNDKKLLDALKRDEAAELGNFPNSATKQWWESKPSGFDESIPKEDLPDQMHVRHFPESDEYFVIVNTNEEITKGIDDESVLKELRKLHSQEECSEGRPRVYVNESTNTFVSFYTVGVDPTDYIFIPN